MDAGGDATESKEHFVLVHGAGHGAWCWFRLLPLFRGSGHRVSCVDLAGAAGSRVDPCSVRSFDEYTAPLVGLLSALPDGEKVTTVTVYPHPLLVIGCLHACTSFFFFLVTALLFQSQGNKI
ncbi:unnamed protein product [Triticum turgidum subsp. durum]|uniref:AB hydrolase-1 domain-containing protein n=1 Tax=Triticum turgidum subsp. durum TaxID=4567 RepID=A0A9R0W9Q3_TRITD|nr:unnamed protein product [Triticum turgidum subsp. durum]